MKDIEIKFKIDGLTYFIIDDLIKEKCAEYCKIQLETNQFLEVMFDKAIREFIRDHQYLITQKLDREISSYDKMLEGKEVNFSELFNTHNFKPEVKEGD